MRVTVEGTLGDMHITETVVTTSVTVYKDGESRRVNLPSRHAETIPVAVCDLIDVVANGGVPRCTGQESMRVVEITMGFLESQRQGNNRVQLPLPRG